MSIISSVFFAKFVNFATTVFFFFSIFCLLHPEPWFHAVTYEKQVLISSALLAVGLEYRGTSTPNALVTPSGFIPFSSFHITGISLQTSPRSHPPALFFHTIPWLSTLHSTNNSAHVFAKNITPIHSVISPDSFVPRPITSSIFHVASTDPFAANMGITISTNKGLSPHTHPYCHLLHYTTTVQSITISEFMWLILSCIITLVSGL